MSQNPEVMERFWAQIRILSKKLLWNPPSAAQQHLTGLRSKAYGILRKNLKIFRIGSNKFRLRSILHTSRYLYKTRMTLKQ